jgi:putative isomerase
LALAVWYLGYDGNLDFAAEVFPRLARAHQWLIEYREPYHDGLLAWGDDRTKFSPIHIDGWAGAIYESGMSNSPMWEDLGFDWHTLSLGKACLDLCSMTALNARVLAALALRIDADPKPFQQDYQRIYQAVNARLWGYDELYHNLRVDGSLSERISPTSFYPLAAGLVPKQRALALIHRHLRNRETFWGFPAIPSLPRHSPFYDGDGDYWRGRIHPSMNYWVWAGLRQYSPSDAAQLAELSRDLFDAEWERERHVHENYSATTGQGEAQNGVYARSAPLYCHGGLLLLPDFEEKIGGAISRLPQVDFNH